MQTACTQTCVMLYVSTTAQTMLLKPWPGLNPAGGCCCCYVTVLFCSCCCSQWLSCQFCRGPSLLPQTGQRGQAALLLLLPCQASNSCCYFMLPWASGSCNISCGPSACPARAPSAAAQQLQLGSSYCIMHNAKPAQQLDTMLSQHTTKTTTTGWIRLIQPSSTSCPKVGRGFVNSMPATMMAGMKPHCTMGCRTEGQRKRARQSHGYAAPQRQCVTANASATYCVLARECQAADSPECMSAKAS